MNDAFHSERSRAYRRRLGNPYASLSMLDDDEPVGYENAAPQKQPRPVDYQNPYRFADTNDTDEGATSEVAANVTGIRSTAAVPKGRLSKKDFASWARRILSQYVPPEGGKVLPQHYRDFIDRNESRSAEDRFLIIEQLRKYDLSQVGNYRAHFNRERDPFTVEKLQRIEQSKKHKP